MPTRSWRDRVRRGVWVAAVWGAALAAWELAYRLLGWNATVFPAPSHVVEALLGLLNVRGGAGADVSGLVGSPLVHALGVSGARLVVGFAISFGLGLVCGLALWRWRFVDSALGPLFLGLQTLPSVCWAPLAVLTLGVGERGVQFVLVMGSTYSMAIAMRDGLSGVPPIYRAAGLMLGASGPRLYTHVLLPACMPALAGTLRQGFTFAWRSLLGAEVILMTQTRGVGVLLAEGRKLNDVGQVVAMMLVMVAVGMVVDHFVFARVERRVAVRFGLARE